VVARRLEELSESLDHCVAEVLRIVWSGGRWRRMSCAGKVASRPLAGTPALSAGASVTPRSASRAAVLLVAIGP